MSRRLRILASVAFGALLADTMLWLAGIWLLSGWVQRWVGQAQTHGWTVSAGRPSWGGWPLAASLTIEKAAISGGAHLLPGGLAWSADRVTASVSLAHPLTLRLSAEGQQFLRIAHAPDIGFVAEQAVAALPLNQGHYGRGRFDAADVTGGIAGSGHPQDVQVGALSIAVQANRAGTDGVSQVTQLVLQVSRIGLPDIGRWPLGATVAELEGTAILTSKLPERGRLEGAAQAAAWRDGGGTLSLQNARLRWGPLAAEAAAELTLDRQLQPAGSGSAGIRGTAPALHAAAEAGLVPPGLALTAQAVLALMPHIETADGDAVRLPFVLRDSTVSVGQIPVARVPDIRW